MAIDCSILSIHYNAYAYLEIFKERNASSQLLMCGKSLLNSLSGCPIAAAEKMAMSQEKSQHDSPKMGQCHEQVHR